MWKPTEIGVVIAERELTLETAEGVRRVKLVIGKPVHAPSAPNDPWLCPYVIIGLDDGLRSIPGEDSLQALVLALEFVRTDLPRLADRIAGKVYWLEENDLDCVTPGRGLIQVFPPNSNETLELLLNLTDALDRGDAELLLCARNEIEAMRLKHRL